MPKPAPREWRHRFEELERDRDDHERRLSEVERMAERRGWLEKVDGHAPEPSGSLPAREDAPEKAAVREGLAENLERAWEFLTGAQPNEEGYWFSQRHHSIAGEFWWRSWYKPLFEEVLAALRAGDVQHPLPAQPEPVGFASEDAIRYGHSFLNVAKFATDVFTVPLYRAALRGAAPHTERHDLANELVDANRAITQAIVALRGAAESRSEQLESAWVAGCNAGQERTGEDERCRESAIGFHAPTKAEAIAAWNRRAAQEPDLVREIGRLRAALSFIERAEVEGEAAEIARDAYAETPPHIAHLFPYAPPIPRPSSTPEKEPVDGQ